MRHRLEATAEFQSGGSKNRGALFQQMVGNQVGHFQGTAMQSGVTVLETRQPSDGFFWFPPPNIDKRFHVRQSRGRHPTLRRIYFLVGLQVAQVATECQVEASHMRHEGVVTVGD